MMSDDHFDSDDSAYSNSSYYLNLDPIGRGPNSQLRRGGACLQPTRHRMGRELALLSAGPVMGHAVMNSIVSSEKVASQGRQIGLCQDNRATVDMVLDPRTRLVLARLMSRGVFAHLFGCVQCGKEANVYSATSATGLHNLAVKVYKTSILVFKDRSRYVEGDFRFRRGYIGSKNPRRMVTQWAEKEMRNLKRIYLSGVRVPRSVEVKANVLVMELVTFAAMQGLPSETVPSMPVVAPRLKDMLLSRWETWRAYVECLAIMRTLYQEAKLVHGDLSEYNILWDGFHLVLIDVSQSVEPDHPQSLDFLKRDCINIRNFFCKRTANGEDEEEDHEAPEPGFLSVMTVFEWVVSLELPKDFPEEAYGDPWYIRDSNTSMDVDGPSAKRELFYKLCTRLDIWLSQKRREAVDSPNLPDADENVFLNTWTPSHLRQVCELESISQNSKRGLYERILGVVATTDDGTRSESEMAEEEIEMGNNFVSADKKRGDDDDSSDKHVPYAFDGHKPADMEKAEWKRKIREERREKRLHKVPKHVKKRHRKKAANP